MVAPSRWFAVAIATVLTATAASSAEESPGRRIALLVGVSDYRASAELRSLPGAANDVARLRDVLVTGGYRPEDVSLLSSGAGGARPTAEAIRGALKGALASCGPNDTVLVAFAGHGLQFGDSPERFFCPYDAVWNNRETLIPLSVVYGNLAECKAKKKLLLVDACRNDPLADSGDREKHAKAISKGFGVAVPDGSDFAAIFSCDKSQTSWEDRRLNHGVFFYHVIRGLAGDAAGKDGAITLDQLLAYTRKSVTEYVKENFEADQHPVLQGQSKNFAIVQPDGVSKAQQRIRDGILALANGDSKAALTAYEEAITLDRKNAEAYYQRGILLSKAGRVDEAIADFTVALHHKRDFLKAYRERANIYYQKNDKTRSLEDYTLALIDDPDNVDILNDRGWIYYEQASYDSALKDFGRAIAAEPGRAKSYYHRSLVFTAKKDQESALKDLDKAIAIDPHHPAFASARLAAAIDAKDDVRVAQEEARQERVTSYIPRSDFQTQEAFNNQSYQVGSYYRDTGRNDRADAAFDRTARQAEGLFDRASKLNTNSMSNKRIADQAAREIERMPQFKQRAIEGRMAQYENALNSGDRARAERVAKDIEGKLPPALRKEFNQARTEDRNEQRGGGIFGTNRNTNGNTGNTGERPGLLGGGRNQGGNSSGGGNTGGGRPTRGGR